MKTATSSVVAREIRQTLGAFMEFGFATYTNTVLESPTRVTWHSTRGDADFLLNRDNLTIEGYLHWLESGHYSALMPDGALIQITYEFDASGIAGHRLAYVPCPVSINDRASRELLDEGFPWGDVIRMKLSETERVLMKTAIRFDFDPANAGENHPATHFTVNTVDCRIACATPLRLGRFLDFVFRTFYPALYREYDYLRSFTKDGWFDSTITDDDRSALHFAWTS